MCLSSHSIGTVPKAVFLKIRICKYFLIPSQCLSTVLSIVSDTVVAMGDGKFLTMRPSNYLIRAAHDE